MARVTVEDCLEKVSNRFVLSILATKRTKQLLNGAKSKITDTDNKQVVVALREIANSDVREATEEEAELLAKKKELAKPAAFVRSGERISISDAIPAFAADSDDE